MYQPSHSDAGNSHASATAYLLCAEEMPTIQGLQIVLNKIIADFRNPAYDLTLLYKKYKGITHPTCQKKNGYRP